MRACACCMFCCNVLHTFIPSVGLVVGTASVTVQVGASAINILSESLGITGVILL